MLPQAPKEENVLKVLDWLNEDHSRYPVVGQRALEAAKELGVTSAEVNVANRRIRFGLAKLITPKEKPKLIKPAKNEPKPNTV
jgi:hypothetical protein